jgi:hypothetical protein
MQIFTYYSRISIPGTLGPLKMLKNHRDQMDVLKLWEKTWSQNGWEPIVLGEKDALEADKKLATQIMEAKNLYRSPNPKQYEMACYLRWVAMIGVTESASNGLMTDYDVMNRNFRPEDLEPLWQENPSQNLLFLAGTVPCAVSGTVSGFRLLADTFLEYEAQPVPRSESTRQNTSDQNILQDFKSRYHVIEPSPCIQWGLNGWEQFPLVHYAHISVQVKRAQAIRRSFHVL